LGGAARRAAAPLLGFGAHPYKRLRYSNRAVGNLKKHTDFSKNQANKDSVSMVIHIVK